MKPDFSSYRRALNISIIGISIQLLVTILLVVYGRIAGDHAAITAAIYAAIGLASWLTLIILFDQHRRERVEAFEAEAMEASGASASSVFDQTGDELRVAARRLRSLYRFFLPVMGLLVGGSMVTVGVLRFNAGRAMIADMERDFASETFFALFVALAATVIGFIFARFCSGMAKQKVWVNLNAGASAIVGVAVFGALIAVGHFVKIAGPDTLLRYLTVILPLLMVVLGVETLLNLLLEIYRPRKAGEHPRPAFDSRMLGLIAAPDRVAQSIGDAINYQFGTDITGSWFYKLFSRWVGALVLFGLFVGWLLTSVAVVQPHQVGVLERFGRQAKVVEPGLHFKLPWPMDRVVVPEFVERDVRGNIVARVRTATGIRVVQLSTPPAATPGQAILWTNEHVTEEVFSIVRADEATGGEDELADFALVAAEVPLHYVIDDVLAFERFAVPEHREQIIKALGRRDVMLHLSTITLDTALGRERTGVRRDLGRRLVSSLNEIGDSGMDAGVRVAFVGYQGVHPPRRAASAFENVIVQEAKNESLYSRSRGRAIRDLTEAAGAEREAERAIELLNELERLREAGAPDQEQLDVTIELERTLAQGGEASRLLSSARAERWTRHMADRALRDQYDGELAGFRANPGLFMAIRWFDTLADVMNSTRVYVVDRPELIDSVFQLQERTSAADIFIQDDTD